MRLTRLRRTRSGLLFHARYIDGVVHALTGQDHTFVRAAAASYTDSLGNTGSAPHSRPRFEVAGGVPALLIDTTDAGTDEELYYDWPLGPAVPWSALVTFVAPPSASVDRVILVGTEAAPDVTVRLHNSGSEFRVFHHNGSVSVDSLTSGAAIGAGDVVEGLVRFQADGSVQAEVSVDGAPIVSADATAANTPAAAWSQPRLYAGEVGTTVSRSLIREIKVHPDTDATLQQLREA